MQERSSTSSLTRRPTAIGHRGVGAAPVESGTPVASVAGHVQRERSRKRLLNIVVPAYNEQDNVRRVHARLARTLEAFEHGLIGLNGIVGFSRHPLHLISLIGTVLAGWDTRT